jgi:hypothetical protein
LFYTFAVVVADQIVSALRAWWITLLVWVHLPISAEPLWFTEAVGVANLSVRAEVARWVALLARFDKFIAAAKLTREGRTAGQPLKVKPESITRRTGMHVAVLGFAIGVTQTKSRA